MSEEFLKLGINHPKAKRSRLSRIIGGVLTWAMILAFLAYCIRFFYIVAHFVEKYW